MTPTKWPEVALGEVCQAVAKRDPLSTGSDQFTYIDLGSVDQSLKEITGPAVLPTADAPSRARQVIAAGDVLVSTVRPNLNAVAKVPPELDGATASTGFTVLRPAPDQLDSSYLAHWVRTTAFIAAMTRRATGASYPAVSDRIVKASLVPLPPVEAQRRIAGVLEDVDVLRAKRRESLTLLDSFTDAVFLDIFGEPATNSKDWPLLKLGTQVHSIRYGTGSPPPYTAYGVPFIRATNIKRGTIDPSDLKFISSEDARRIAKCKVNAGDLLVVRSGVNTGDCALVPLELDGACAAFDMIVELPDANAVFCNHLLNSDFGKRVLAPLTRRAAQPHLNAEQLRSIELISPPNDTRIRFAGRVSAVKDQRSVLERSAERLDQLFASLQQRAFRGDL